MDNSWSDVSDNNTEELKIVKQRVPDGFIINSNIFLHEYNWHTAVKKDEFLLHCAVCDEYYLVKDFSSHIANVNHVVALDNCKPLKKFELTITRQIDNYYHCAVCNDLFKISTATQHFESKSHENKLLYAINRVSDIMYDLSLNICDNDNGIDKSNKNQVYHFNAVALNRNHVFSDNDSESYSDGVCSENLYEDNIWESDVEELDQKMALPGSSYATMARKAKTVNIPKIIEKNLNGNIVKVTCDSWHMIIKPSLNKYYCYVCKVIDHIKFKSEHCDSSLHLAKIEKCSMVNTYPGYFVRKVDKTFYHCGHCNRIQPSNNIKEHLYKKHPKKLRNFTEEAKSLPLKNTVSDTGHTKAKNGRKHKVSTSDSCSIGEENNKTRDNYLEINIPSKELVDSETDKIPLNPDIHDDIIIVPFNYTLKVKFLAFNVIFKQNGGHFCGLCHISLKGDENLSQHSLFDSKHISMLQQTLFVQDFSCNLIRYIGNAYHCTLCNIPLNENYVQTHITEIEHVVNLGNALGIDIKHPNTDTKAETNKPKTVDCRQDKAIEPKTKAVEAQTNINESADKKTNEFATDISELNLDIYKDNTEINAQLNKRRTKDEEEIDDLDSYKENKNNNNNVTQIAIKSDLLKGYIDDEDFNCDTDEVYFNNEELVYVKIYNTYTRISNSAYHTILFIGDGTRFCFLCSLKLYPKDVGRHVDSRAHTDNVKEYKFLENYSQHLLRQIFLQYHCAICNVLFYRRDLKRHIEWPIHKDNAKTSNVSKGQLKNGIHSIIATTEKEMIHLNAKEPLFALELNARIVPQVKSDGGNCIDKCKQRTSKMVVVKDQVYKICWYNWHGLVQAKGPSVDYRCLICQTDVENDVTRHADGETHKRFLENFLESFSPALIRKISTTQSHCVLCNIELTTADTQAHITGKKHRSVVATTQEQSSLDNYDDCMPEVFYL